MLLANQPTKRSLTVDYRIVCGVLLLSMLAMLVAWKPWAASAEVRTIEVSGQTTLTARPDEFVFYPTYTAQSTNRQAAVDELVSKSNTIVAELKKRGVSDSNIRTSSSGYGYPVLSEKDIVATSYNLQITVTVDTEKLAQKVQDYLLTTAPSGVISPQPAFSKKMRAVLENKARAAATKDARAKAEQMGKNLGFHIGKVKSVSDQQNDGSLVPLASRGATFAEDAKLEVSLPVQPGENDFPYSVRVVYFIR